jgi:hypothetical protein
MAKLTQRQTSRLNSPMYAAAVVLAILAAGIVPAPAEAGRGSWPERAEAVAAEYWGERGRSCDSDSVAVNVVPDGAVRGDALTTVGGCLDWEDYQPQPGESVIRISRHARSVGWLHFCSLVIHEYGHLLGLEHSRKRGSIMFPAVRGKNLQRRAC